MSKSVCPTRLPHRFLSVLLLLGTLNGCGGPSSVAPTQSGPSDLRGGAANQKPPCFIDWTEQSGIEFVHNNGSTGRRFIVESVSSGLALFDYDGDGLTDIYFCNGHPLPRDESSVRTRHALYKNLGNMKFEDVTEQAGLANQAFGLGVAVADYNNDGFPDIYLSNYGKNYLYGNNGDGSFTDQTAEAGVDRGDRVGAGGCFFDMDADGDIDLFVGNYVVFSENEVDLSAGDRRSAYPGPMDFQPERNTLFRNDGNGAFTDVSESSFVSAKPGTAMGAICGDFDQDGDTDVYVANDEMANFFYENDGSGVFQECGVYRGTAYDGLGLAHGSMGVDAGDIDNDGAVDLFVTAFQNETDTLYRNLGNGTFEDATRRYKAAGETAKNVTWGCCIADLDNDGDRDLLIATGHLDETDQSNYRKPTILMTNLLVETGVVQFEERSRSSCEATQVARSTRAAAVGDLDNDGDLDAVLLNSGEKPTVMKNMTVEEGSDQGWLRIRVRGTGSSRDGLGARVVVTVGENTTLVDEVRSGRGYQSSWGDTLHFGVGPANLIDRIEVHWLGGGVDVLEEVAVNQQVTIVQGTTQR